jgi:hypothetical protein
MVAFILAVAHTTQCTNANYVVESCELAPRAELTNELLGSSWEGRQAVQAHLFQHELGERRKVCMCVCVCILSMATALY